MTTATAEKTTIVLNDRTWGRGDTGGQLCRAEDGRMCIVGHVLATKYGVSPSAMVGAIGPYDVPGFDLTSIPSLPYSDLMDANDVEACDFGHPYTDDERVARLNEILAPHDIEVRYGAAA